MRLKLARFAADPSPESGVPLVGLTSRESGRCGRSLLGRMLLMKRSNHNRKYGDHDGNDSEGDE